MILSWDSAPLERLRRRIDCWALQIAQRVPRMRESVLWEDIGSKISMWMMKCTVSMSDRCHPSKAREGDTDKFIDPPRSSRRMGFRLHVRYTCRVHLRTVPRYSVDHNNNGCCVFICVLRLVPEWFMHPSIHTPYAARRSGVQSTLRIGEVLAQHGAWGPVPTLCGNTLVPEQNSRKVV